ncbi:MAG: hypothetical protein A2087_10005 [Spirochaetes bacterium GWD1_61_31]|nr:MAG: hypothetical protein A2Y37_01825 [Spirochaetes bacterium GWB1_60_80]OHD40615.1 MAG: hypothetical protein A2087_10005 [Spirochaetes bacterium GWD1_61_31]OHD43887.1 MAG: hypothetical protein A2Y35_12355 [Spirochaetes bacterium GWE1_60_18]OHD59758.1 MAG: hypothetical protein A2Y32_02210 [Spirochaetes bacterium GWF1_60_12]HAP43520.1 hypothetical protein [Spirochaetaceae bacterium]
MAGALGSYAFLNAKLKTRLSQLLPQETITGLIRAKSLPEAFLLLRGTRFEGLEASYNATGDLRAGEALLYAADASVFAELRRLVKGPIAAFFEALSLRFEIDNLKQVLRLWFDGRFRGGDSIGQSAYLDRQPIVHAIDIDALLAATDAAAVATALKGTPYAAIIAVGLAEAIERGNLFKLELALDRRYFDGALAAAAKLSKADRTIAERALRMDADASNADRLIRFKTCYNLDAAEALDYLIPYGSASRARGLGEAYSGDHTAGLMVQALGGQLGRLSSFIAAAGDGKASLGLLVKALRQLALDEAWRLLGGYPFSIAIPLAYASLRHEDIRVALAILNAKYYGLAEERIRDAL